MFLHLVPKIINYQNKVELLNLSIPNFDYNINSEDLVLRKPFPNKRYHVACRRKGKKAMNGILVKIPNNIINFSVVCQWLIDERENIEHIVNYTILDDDFEFISDDHTMLYASDSKELGLFERRSDFKLAPVSTQPYMEIEYRDNSAKSKNNEVFDVYNNDTGILQKRVENIEIHTIEKERFFKRNLNGRLPELEDAFFVNI